MNDGPPFARMLFDEKPLAWEVDRDKPLRDGSRPAVREIAGGGCALLSRRGNIISVARS